MWVQYKCWGFGVGEFPRAPSPKNRYALISNTSGAPEYLIKAVRIWCSCYWESITLDEYLIKLFGE